MNNFLHPRPVVLAGEKVFLSHIFAEDAALLAQWFADLELTALLGQQGRSFTLEQEQQWIATRANGIEHERTFAIVLRDSERLIGTCSLHNINLLHGTAELGIAIGDKAAWGHGYGREAVRLLTGYGFQYLNLYNITSVSGCTVLTNGHIALTWLPDFVRLDVYTVQYISMVNATTAS